MESPFSEATKKSGNKKIKKLVFDERTKKLVINERKKLVIKVRNKFGDERKKKLVKKKEKLFFVVVFLTVWLGVEDLNGKSGLLLSI